MCRLRGGTPGAASSVTGLVLGVAARGFREAGLVALGVDAFIVVTDCGEGLGVGRASGVRSWARGG